MNIEDRLINFIDNSPNAYYCINNIKNILLDNEFEQLYENEVWKLNNNKKYFVIRNDSSLIAFKTTNKVENTGFNLVATHTDSPSFSIKSNADIFENQYLKLNVDKYGGVINYSWLDRPLSLAGRIITLNNGVYEKRLINIDKDLLVIPSQAIHINREVNVKNELNNQIDMLPIMALDNNKSLKDVITENIDGNINKISDYDLYLYNRDKGKKVGINNEFILSPRLDDLSSVYPALESFINSNNNNSINVFCAFNNEEIGSLTKQGADSTFLIDSLSRICKSLNIDLFITLSNSFLISADNAHAIHPNVPSKSDPTNKVLLNNGVVIKHHINYTTDSLTSSLFKGICDDANVPYQEFACRADMKCGETLGGISQSHVSIDSIDIGLPQLAMHSANETIGTKDVTYMYKSLLEFYSTTFIKNKDKVTIIKNI